MLKKLKLWCLRAGLDSVPEHLQLCGTLDLDQQKILQSTQQATN